MEGGGLKGEGGLEEEECGGGGGRERRGGGHWEKWQGGESGRSKRTTYGYEAGTGCKGMGRLWECKAQLCNRGQDGEERKDWKDREGHVAEDRV